MIRVGILSGIDKGEYLSLERVTAHECRAIKPDSIGCRHV